MEYQSKDCIFEANNITMDKKFIEVAGHIFSIEADHDIFEILPSLKTFARTAGGETLFDIIIDNTLIPAWSGNKIGVFPCPSATFEVHKESCGAYIILVSNDRDIPCAFIKSDAEQKRFTIVTRGSKSEVRFGINNSIMLIYAICTAAHKTLLMHSSVVENNGKGYMFLGVSGRGKSTHSDLWVKHIDGSRLINDDNPVIRISDDGTPIVYGSPWSGKRPVYMDVNYPIGGLTAIEQATENKITKEGIPAAFGIILSSCSTFKFDKERHMNVCRTITNILERIPVHTLYCRPDEEAARVSSSTLGA